MCQLLIINDSNLHGVSDNSNSQKFAYLQSLSKSHIRKALKVSGRFHKAEKEIFVSMSFKI